MPRKGKERAEPDSEEQVGRRDLPLGFDVDGAEVTSEKDDPWHVARRGIMIKPLGSWWNYVGDEGKKPWECEIVGYIKSHTFVDGKTQPAYIIENGGWHYAMDTKGVWKLLRLQDRPKAADSDDEDLARPAVDDANHNRGGAARRGRPAAAARAPNAPRLGDEWADEINAEVDRIHGDKEEVDETVDDETGEVNTSSKRVPSGWDADTHSDTPHECTVPKGLKLKRPIPRQHCPRGKPCTWRILNSFRWCWPVIQMVANGSNKYNDYHVELHEAEAAGAKKLDVSKTAWPKRIFDDDGDAIGGGITEEHYEGYCAIILFMGLIRCRDMEWHWSLPSTRGFHHMFVRRIMGRNFFHLIRRFLHYSDARAKVPRGDWKPAATGKAWVPPPDGYDMIYNFRPIMDACNLAWCQLVFLAANLTYDEQMVKNAMHTKLSRRQPNKPIRDGFQVHLARTSRIPLALTSLSSCR